MVSILPTKRSPFELIGQAMSQLGQNAPQLLEKRFQTQQGLSAIDQLQQQLEASGGDINKMLPALARAYTLNPNLERSGLGQTFMQQAKTKRAFPPKGTQPNVSGQPTAQPSTQPGASPELAPAAPAQSTFATPGPFNIMTNPEIDAESERYAQSVTDPNGYQTRQAQLSNQNTIATQQREALEDMALKSGIKPDELPRFMQVGAKFDPRNPSEWAQKAIRAYNEVKSNDKKIKDTFIPGLGSGLLGRDRSKALKRLEGSVQDLVKNGLEQETRNDLADKYLSKTEIEELIHPLTPQKEQALKTFPKGTFPPAGYTKSVKGQLIENPFASYEEVLEKSPQALQGMQNRLADFFYKNVDKNTSLLALRDKLVSDRDYDWRQIGPAIREAEKRGLKLEPFQSTEMSTIETQAPMQSLPDIFQSLDRVIKYFRGNK